MMESQELAGQESDFIDAFMHIDRNIQQRAKLPQTTLNRLTTIIETRRDYLLGTTKRTEEELRANIAEWEAELSQLASVIDSTPNSEITTVFSGILHASGIDIPEFIES